MIIFHLPTYPDGSSSSRVSVLYVTVDLARALSYKSSNAEVNISPAE